MSKAYDVWIESARAVPLAAEIERRGLRLKRVGLELVGPCPRCGGTDRFAINAAKGAWHCRKCDRGGDTIDLVRHLDRVGFVTAIETLTGEPRPDDRDRATAAAPEQASGHDGGGDDDDEYERRQHEKAAWLWGQRQPITGSIAETYLRKARGYHGLLPPTLAFLPARTAAQHPCMIAAFALPDEPEPGLLAAPGTVGAVHLTLLRADGSGKAEVEPNKLVIGSPGGLPIVLAPPNDLLGLAITEGIEDALSVYAATGLGAWAAGSAPFLPKIADAVPDWIECVTIVADADPNGQRHARTLAGKLDARGIEVLIEGLA